VPPPEGPITRILRYRELIALIAGAGTSFAFAPYGLFYLGILGPAVLFLLWEYASPRDAARTGFWFGAALFGAGTWWIYTAIHDFGEAPAWLAIFLLAALLAIKGAYYALLGYVLVRIAPDPSPSRSLLLIPAGWTLLEWLRGWLFTGFPWLQLGYAREEADSEAPPKEPKAAREAPPPPVVPALPVVPPRPPEVRGDRAHGAPLGLRLAAHRARMDEAGEQARHHCAPAGRDPAERKMACRESRGDARQVPEPESRGARRAHHRLARILHSRARPGCRRLPRGDPRRIGGARL
jgi:hypothetical protein